MTVDTPLTCYICGETGDRTTVDLIGCFEDRQAQGNGLNKSMKKSRADTCPSAPSEKRRIRTVRKTAPKMTGESNEASN